MAKKIWTKEEIIAEAKKHGSKTEFNRKSRTAYDAAKQLNMLNTLYKKRKTRKREYGRWTQKRITEIAKNYKTKSEMVRQNPNAYQAAWRNNMLDKLFPNSTKEWTVDIIEEAAAKYKTKTTFKKNAAGAYEKARLWGLLNELYPRQINPNQ